MIPTSPKGDWAININNLVKFHGHLCDGLVVVFQGLKAALLELYPDWIDRTNTRIVSKSPPYYTSIRLNNFRL